MRLIYGPNRIALVLAGTRRYIPEQLLQRMLNQRKPYFLEVDGERISVDPDRELWVVIVVRSALTRASESLSGPESTTILLWDQCG